MAQRHEQLHVETSGMAHFGAVEFAVDRIGHERVLFGSGGPGRALQAPLNMVLLANLSDDAKRAILAGNACRLLDLSPAQVDLKQPTLPTGAFDVHSHYMPASAYDVPVVSDEELLPWLRTWGTTTLASSSFNAFAADMIAGNRETVAASAGGGGQGGLIVLDPADRDASAEALERWRDAPGIRGAKIHSFYSGVASTDPRMAELFRLAAARDCPVKIHNDGPDWPAAIATYARAHPRLRILLAHSGPGMPSIEGARLAAEHEGVFLELGSSFANLPVIRQLVAIAGPAKIAWGTDAPLLDPRFVLGSYMDAGIGPTEAPEVYRVVPNESSAAPADSRRRAAPGGRRLVSEPIRIMGIYAHPADVATEAAGTMAVHADLGDDVTAVVLSDGIRMHPHYLQGGEGREPMTLAQYREFKRAEVRRAAAILGIAATEFMGWDENFWDATDQRVETLARLIATQRPDVVITHYPVGAHLIDSNAFTGVYASVRSVSQARSCPRSTVSPATP